MPKATIILTKKSTLTLASAHYGSWFCNGNRQLLKISDGLCRRATCAFDPLTTVRGSVTAIVNDLRISDGLCRRATCAFDPLTTVRGSVTAIVNDLKMSDGLCRRATSFDPLTTVRGSVTAIVNDLK